MATIETLEFHELANLFPLLSNEQLQELASDIKCNGLRDPITLLDGKILDGRNRYNAAKLTEFNLSPNNFQQFNGGDPVTFVISKNIHRRHLTEDQRAKIAAELYAKLPKKAVGGDRNPLSHSCDNRNDAPSADSQKEKAAKQLNVSIRAMERAAAIQNKNPILAEEIKAGTKTIKQAEKELHINGKKSKKPAAVKRGHATPQLDKAREIIRGSIEAGEPVNTNKLEQEHAISHVTFDMAITAELARKQALAEPLITPNMLSLTAQQKLNLAIKQHIQKLDAEEGKKIHAAAMELLHNTIGPRLEKEQKEAKRIIKGREGIMTRKEFTEIRVCLHADWVTDAKQKERYDNAFKLFTRVEKYLLNEKESPTDFVHLPKTAAEWAEAKRQATAARRAKRNSKNGTNLEKT